MITAPPPCPRCTRVVRTTHPQTSYWCSKCARWQFQYQMPFRTFGGAVYSHTGCVACSGSALCRDMTMRRDAGGCAYGTHVHGLDEACEFGRLVG